MKKIIILVLTVIVAVSVVVTSTVSVSAAESGLIFQALDFNFVDVFVDGSSVYSKTNSQGDITFNASAAGAIFWCVTSSYSRSSNLFKFFDDTSTYKVTLKYKLWFDDEIRSDTRSFINGVRYYSYSPYGSSSIDSNGVITSSVLVDYSNASAVSTTGETIYYLNSINVFFDSSTAYSKVRMQIIEASVLSYDASAAGMETFMYGDEELDVSADTDKVDNAVGEMEGSTDEALGGKSDEDIQNELNSAMDTDSVEINWNAAGKISTFFDQLLNAFGTGYKSVVVLSLSLGLAAFLIGRRYG